MVPLLPAARLVLLISLAAYLAARPRRGPVDQRRDDALDRLEEGVTADRIAAPGLSQMDGTARWRRTLRAGARAWDIDLSLAGRLRLRRL